MHRRVFAAIMSWWLTREENKYEIKCNNKNSFDVIIETKCVFFFSNIFSSTRSKISLRILKKNLSKITLWQAEKVYFSNISIIYLICYDLVNYLIFYDIVNYLIYDIFFMLAHF